MDKILEMKQQRLAKLEAARALHKKSVDENRDFVADEQSQYDALTAEMKALDARIKRTEELAADEKAMAEISKPGIKPDTKSPDVHVMGDRDLKRPFESFGDNLKAIAEAARPGGTVDRRLLEMRAPSGGSTTVQSDGGYAVQTDFAQGIMTRGFQTGILASRCDQVEIGENADGLEVPYVDETSRATGSRWGGVQIYWAGEAEAVAQSKPKIGKMETRLEDLKGLAYATNRLLQDARAMSQIYMTAFSEEFGFMLDDAILNGTGAGMPLGILNSEALVTVPKENGQVAGTVDFKNVSKMRSRQWVRSRPNALWLINQDVEPALDVMTIPVGTGGVPVYLPATGAAGQPYDTLYGRPVVPIEQAQTLGTVGDIVLVDLSQYLLIKKGEMEMASSMHVRFIYDEMTFKFTIRTNGQPKWKKAVTPAKGTNTISPFIALATRA